MEKICLQCQLSKPLTDFSKYKANADGLAKVCRTCYIENKGRRPYTKERKDRIAQWDKDHPEKVQQRLHKWIANNRSKANEATRQWSQNHSEEKRVQVQKWRHANPEKVSEYRDRRSARKRGAPRTEKVNRAYIFARDKMICQICHTRVTKKDASLDHIIPLSKGGNHTHDNIVLAHKQCNSRKHNNVVVQQLLLFG